MVLIDNQQIKTGEGAHRVLTVLNALSSVKRIGLLLLS